MGGRDVKSVWDGVFGRKRKRTVRERKSIAETHCEKGGEE